MTDLISISRSDKYKVIGCKEGGMGKIYILEKLNKQPMSAGACWYRSRRMQDRFKFICRDFLVAKAVKSAGLEKQFLRELNIWITLNQPGIAPLLKVMREGSELLGIMPAYDSNLRDYSEKHPRSGALCLRSMRPCVKGLEEVSEAGVLHLDLKPENFLVTTDDNKLQIDVSDWGISNMKIENARALGCLQQDFGTIVGAGTIPYMSPERLLRSKPEVRSDIFSLGVMFYELLLGERPYHHRSPCEVQIVSGQYMDRVRQAVREGRLPGFVARMLEPDLGRRQGSYPEILEFLDSLRV